jgi:hypothetical protein
MKPTGRFNPITKEEILQVEEHDIDFWHIDWDDLSLEQKATICSFLEIGFLATRGEFKNDHLVKSRYEYYQLKNIIDT